MKHLPSITTADILHKIENIEKEGMDLKLSILGCLNHLQFFDQYLDCSVTF